MAVELPTPWPVTVEAALACEAAARVRAAAAPYAPTGRIGRVCGLDVAYDKDSDLVAAAAVVLDRRTLVVLDRATAVGRAAFPYVPGLLAFRELPPLVDAWNALGDGPPPDLVVCDGYGVAHPRRFGLACHVGLLTGVPTVGVAKTPFIGSYEPPDRSRGRWTPLIDVGETVGRALRSQDDVKEIFVSVGLGIDLDRATTEVLALCPTYRLPETTRAADQLSRAALKAALQGG